MITYMHHITLIALAVGVTGCTRAPSRVLPPSLNANKVAQAAIDQCDTDGNGMIAGEELKASPALLDALPTVDANGDGAASATEIAARVQSWLDSGLGMMTLPCHVQLDGKPLVGATVTLEPEKYMSDAIHPAVGISDASGMVHLTIAQAHRPAQGGSGVTVGFYKVRVSKSVGGREVIPAKYNVNTIQGCEVAPDAIELRQRGLELKLTSR